MDPNERTFEAHWTALLSRKPLKPPVNWTSVEKNLAQLFYDMGRLDQAVVSLKEVQSPSQTKGWSSVQT